MPARPTPEQWAQLSRAHIAALLNGVRPLLEGDGRVELDPHGLAHMTSSSVDEAKDLLDKLVMMEIFELGQRSRCGCCQEALTEEETGQEVCVHCEQPFVDCGIDRLEIFVRDAARARDVRWMLVLHGMNTSGEWQEKLSWLCATTHKRSLPVFIYKYGKIRPGVLLRWRQRQLVEQLAKKIELLSEEYGLGDNGPDVVAHSFGTWMIGHVLLQNPSIKVSRLILAGSILRPDFDWWPLIDSGRVDAVLNHCGARDRWVPAAHLLIPDAGPSGTKGFQGTSVVHREEGDFGHSSFFKGDTMNVNYRDVWDIFLKRPLERIQELQLGEPAARWVAVPQVVREIVRYLLLIALMAVTLLLCISTIVGSVDVVRWL